MSYELASTEEKRQE